MKFLLKTLSLIFFFSFFLSCNPQPEKEPVTQLISSSGTAEMIKVLQKVSANAKVNVRGYGDNPNTLAKLTQAKKNAQGTKVLEISFALARYYLRAGMSDRAVGEYESIRTFLERNNLQLPPKETLFLRKSLAIAYLRMGEQQNCIDQKEPTACILPISKAAQYKMTKGSRAAMQLYNQVLSETPDDAEARYLLNLAAMTIGEYPEGVSEKFRLPKDVFASNITFPIFNNVAAQTKTDIVGLSGGVAAEDFNGDELIDLMLTSWGTDNQTELLLNDGKGSFKNATAAAGLTGITGGLNMQHADYDNDGDQDVFILRGAWYGDLGQMPNSLLQNKGDGTFEDVTVVSGLYSQHPTQTAIWADFNLDGYLDLFIGNETKGKDKRHPCELFMNNQDGTFTESAAIAGIDFVGFVKGVTASDVNDDGYDDIYISTFGQSNRLFLNTGKGGIPIFKEIGKQAGVTEPIFSFPCWFFDYDNDGDEDLFVSSYGAGNLKKSALLSAAEMSGMEPSAGKPVLYENIGMKDGIPQYKNRSKELGLDDVLLSMGSNYGDLNNDGFVDFYVGTGTPEYESIVPNRMYLNQGGQKFVDVTYSGGFGHIQKGHGVSFADFDNDGDQDVYAVMGGAYKGDIYQNVLFENPAKNIQNQIKLRLEGVKANRAAIGSKVILTLTENGKTRKIYRRVGTGGSFGDNTLRLEIGTGKATIIDQLEVVWSDGNRTAQSFKNVEINQFYHLKQGGILEQEDLLKVVF